MAETKTPLPGSPSVEPTEKARREEETLDGVAGALLEWARGRRQDGTLTEEQWLELLALMPSRLRQAP